MGLTQGFRLFTSYQSNRKVKCKHAELESTGTIGCDTKWHGHTCNDFGLRR